MIARFITTFTTCLLAVLCLFVPTRADYHYASHTGSNVYPYTSWATATDSIQLAIDAASPGDTVYIGVGEWIEEAVTEFYDSIAIIGMGWDSTFWHTVEYRTPALRLGDGCSVEEIKFRHPDWRAISVLNGGPSASIRNCKFVNSYWGVSVNGGTSEVVNCVFDSCSRAIDILDFSGEFLISNNLVLGCYGNWALFIYSSSAVTQNNIIISNPWPNALAAIEGPNNVIRNNVIIKGLAGIASSGSGYIYGNLIKDFINTPACGIYNPRNKTISNNSIVNCWKGISYMGDSCYINYNNFWRNVTDIDGVPFDSVGNIFCDPMYVSDEDFHLQAYSPLIDAGDPSVFDVDGSRSDIGFYGGPLGESYIYVDYPPAVPCSLQAIVETDSITISWRYNTEADFARYQLYKDTIQGFTPSVFNIIAYPETSLYIDTDFDIEHNYYYRINAVDNQDNISDYSDELSVIMVSIWGTPGVETPEFTKITSNYPNPFNSQTTIVYNVANIGPIPAEIKIEIYDILGRKVRTLLSERKEVGTHSITWDGTDEYGSERSSGVYFALISQWGLKILNKPGKLMLVR